MKCSYCGAILAEDELRCPVCGTEIQIVPDYNPLEDVLTDQVKGSFDQTYEEEEKRQRTERIRIERERARQATGKTAIDERERARRRRQAERKRMLAKRKRQRMLIIMGAISILIIILGVVGYQNSFDGQLKKGHKLIESMEYDEAMIRFQKAIDKQPERRDGYDGLAEVYIAQKDLEKAEQVFLQAITEQPDNLELYTAAVEFYVNTKQESKIAYLLENCESKSIKKALDKYASGVPEFSLDEEEVYDEVQALELTSNGEAIYYTTDKTDPTISSTKYTEPIKLQEGETEVRAISVNKDGIPSVVVSKTYVIEFPMADAPAVTPSTGQYSSVQTIKISVPENYEAYYTTDGTPPKPGEGSTKKYTDGVKMPEGSTIFKAVLVDAKGRISDITTRNYELIIESE